MIAAIVAFPHPSVAAAVKKKAAAASTALVKPTEVAQPSSPIAKFAKKAGKIFQKIIFGVNSKAASRMLKKAGDTRAEISGTIIRDVVNPFYLTTIVDFPFRLN